MDLEQLKNSYPEISLGRAEDLSNKIFGKWKVLYRTLNDNGNKPMWLCQCQCSKNTIKPVSARTLKAGTSTNCGCERLKTIAQKADEKIHIKDDNGVILLKKCFRCQCWKSLDNFWKNCAQKDGYSGECKECQKTSLEGRYNIYKKNALRRKIDFKLSKNEFNFLTLQKCFYCGENKKIGIDRINSNLGYILNNCVPCCEACNKMKLDYDVNFWLQHIQKILQYQKENNNAEIFSTNSLEKKI